MLKEQKQLNDYYEKPFFKLHDVLNDLDKDYHASQ